MDAPGCGGLHLHSPTRQWRPGARSWRAAISSALTPTSTALEVLHLCRCRNSAMTRSLVHTHIPICYSMCTGVLAEPYHNGTRGSSSGREGRKTLSAAVQTSFFVRSPCMVCDLARQSGRSRALQKPWRGATGVEKIERGQTHPKPRPR